MTTWLRRWWNAPRPASPATNLQTRLKLETMEAREVPAALTNPGVALVSYGGSADATAELLNATTNAPILPAFHPFPGFHGAITAASADVNDDGVPDLIVAAQGAGGFVEVFDGATGGVQSARFVFPGFNGPVSIGAGDVDGDGYADILVTANIPGAPVGAFSGRDGSLLSAFYAAPGITAPTSVTGADLYGTGRDEIVVGVGGAVGVYGADGGLQGVAFPFPGSTGPISVAAGDVNGDGITDIVVGSGPGTPAEVKVYSGPGLGLVEDFQPLPAGVTTGINVQTADGNGDGIPDIFVSLQGGAPLLVPIYSTSLLYQPTQAGYYGGGGQGTYSGYDYDSSGDTSDDGYSYNDGSYGYSPPPYTGDPGTGYSPPTDSGSDSGGDYSGGDYSGGDDSGGDYSGDDGSDDDDYSY